MTWSATVTTRSPYANSACQLRCAQPITPDSLLLGREPLAGVEPKALAVEHRVLHDGQSQLRVFLRTAEALGEGGILGQGGGELVGDALGETGGKKAGRDREHPNAEA